MEENAETTQSSVEEVATSATEAPDLIEEGAPKYRIQHRRTRYDYLYKY